MIIIKREDIRWGEMGSHLYGNQITYHADGHVALKNPLLAPGETLKAWFPVSTTRLETSPASLFLENHTYRLYEDAGSTDQWPLSQ